MSVTKLQSRFISLAKRLNAWRGVSLLVAFVAFALLLTSLVLNTPFLNSLQAGFLLLICWSLLGYFFIACFSLCDQNLPTKATWFMRLKHKLVNIFIRIITLTFVLLTAITLYLTVRLISLFSG